MVCCQEGAGNREEDKWCDCDHLWIWKDRIDLLVLVQHKIPHRLWSALTLFLSLQSLFLGQLTFAMLFLFYSLLPPPSPFLYHHFCSIFRISLLRNVYDFNFAVAFFEISYQLIQFFNNGRLKLVPFREWSIRVVLLEAFSCTVQVLKVSLFVDPIFSLLVLGQDAPTSLRELPSGWFPSFHLCNSQLSRWSGWILSNSLLLTSKTKPAIHLQIYSASQFTLNLCQRRFFLLCSEVQRYHVNPILPQKCGRKCYWS